MKIAYIYDVIHPYVIGGVQKRIWEVATRLSKRGHDVTIFGMKHWQGNDIIRKDGMRICSNPASGTISGGRSPMLGTLGNFLRGFSGLFSLP